MITNKVILVKVSGATRPMNESWSSGNNTEAVRKEKNLQTTNLSVEETTFLQIHLYFLASLRVLLFVGETL